MTIKTHEPIQLSMKTIAVVSKARQNWLNELEDLLFVQSRHLVDGKPNGFTAPEVLEYYETKITKARAKVDAYSEVLRAAGVL